MHPFQVFLRVGKCVITIIVIIVMGIRYAPSPVLATGQGATEGVALYNLTDSPLFTQALYTATSPSYNTHLTLYGSQGAGSSTNLNYDSANVDPLTPATSSSYCLIEQQRYLAESMQAGLHNNLPQRITDAKLAITWGFTHQGTDNGVAGGFPCNNRSSQHQH